MVTDRGAQVCRLLLLILCKENALNTLVKLTAVVALVAVLGGCGTAAILQKDSAAPGPDESVIILGVKPDDFRLHIFEGAYASGGVTVERYWSSPVINGVAKDGYLVAKAKAGQVQETP